MKIAKAHYKFAKRVKNYKEIKNMAREMISFLYSDQTKLEGNYDKVYVLSHTEVSETPYAFFVCKKELVKSGMFRSQVIINPEIIHVSNVVDRQVVDPVSRGLVMQKQDNKIEVKEGCLMFPFRDYKTITRYYKIGIKYQIPAWFGRLKTIEEQVEGQVAHIFQHHIDHMEGKNIYFSDSPRLKWWDLDGTKRGIIEVDTQ